MARAAVRGRLARRLAWQPATLVERRVETPSATTIVLTVPEWIEHVAGQHVDVRLTAEDGYRAQRSYSIASAPDADRIELTVQRVVDGEVSPYLADDLQLGDVIEVRGPVGGWFVWRPDDPGPVLLLGGGSGIVPLMAMLRTRRASGSAAPFRALYSVRTPDDVLYRDEPGVEVTHLYTRVAPPDWPRRPGRLTAADLAESGWPPADAPTCYVCGPTGFVEAAADLLVALGHDPARIRTERFGPTGG